MAFADGQRFGKIQIKKVGEYPERAKDPKSKIPAKLKVLLPDGPEARTVLSTYDFAYTVVAEPKKGKSSDDSTPVRLYWVHGGKLVSTKETFVGLRPLHANLETGRGMFLVKETLFEVDLQTGSLERLEYSGWDKRGAANMCRYLAEDRVLMHGGAMAIGKRSGSSIQLDPPLEARSLGFAAIGGGVFFAADEPALVLGYHAGVMRVLADLGVWGSQPWLAATNTIRFYVSPLHNKALTPTSCGAFELDGALDAWEHCFREGHEKDYPEV